ncbi:adenosylcobinamide-GDP ribazoletransferase [Pararobbsia silviterrae]|uniref:Adenosylcobinamide-GDP ribazoletransferase n=1 Tax=Pararobbsia silviterrae TaxID=1792498 RepID=A0A494Y1W3_9BURK|nr:adenosylcobinamide-GDP ribazoletransferase [Pararobbsia silviterrae]RKP56697.1 adenosylcobinamide-GDP ribazoletransferase [Pararobbsia silviterrae]
MKADSPRAGRRRGLAAALVDEMRYAWTALGYFTRVPIPKWVGYEAHYLESAARWFPCVGLFVGGIAAGVFALCAHVVAQPVAVLISMAATVLLTGAFHEDGLADCCDAFWGGYTREDVLRIMHDSRIGAFGAIGIVIALLLKWQTIAALPATRVAGLLIAAHAASRACAISYVMTLDYVRAQGKAKPVVQRLGPASFAWIALTGLPALFWPDWRLGLLTAAILAGMRYALGRWFVRRIGGYTGDCLGFAQQLFELAIYLVALAWIGR